MDHFAESWRALLDLVDGLDGADFARSSGCRGWLIRDLVCHLVIDAQDVLITLATPTTEQATVNAVSYWALADGPRTDDPLDALIPRLAAAYGDPELLRFHFADVGSAAGRAAALADPDTHVQTKDEVLTAGDYLAAYQLEATLHHLDLINELPDAPRPSEQALTRARSGLEAVAGFAFPAGLADDQALLIVTGRRPMSAQDEQRLADHADRIPLILV